MQLTYRGTSPRSRARVLAQVVDERTGLVLGNQITPIPLRLDGRRRQVSRRLEVIAATVAPGHRLTLQLVAQSSAYNVFPAGGSVRFASIRVAYPTVAS